MATIDLDSILGFLLHILETGRVVSLVVGHAPVGDKDHLFRLLQDKVCTGIAALAFRGLHVGLQGCCSVVWEHVQICLRIVLHRFDLRLNERVDSFIFSDQSALHNILNSFLSISLDNIVRFNSLFSVVCLRAEFLFTFWLTLKIEVVFI